MNSCSESLHSFISIANQKSVRYSCSKSYFTNIEFQNVNKAFVYITDCNPSLIFDEFMQWEQACREDQKLKIINQQSHENHFLI